MLNDFAGVDADALAANALAFEAASAEAFETGNGAIVRLHGDGQGMPDVRIADGATPAAADAILEFGVGAEEFALAGDDVGLGRGVGELLKIRLQKSRWEWFGHAASC